MGPNFFFFFPQPDWNLPSEHLWGSSIVSRWSVVEFQRHCADVRLNKTLSGEEAVLKPGCILDYMRPGKWFVSRFFSVGMHLHTCAVPPKQPRRTSHPSSSVAWPFTRPFPERMSASERTGLLWAGGDLKSWVEPGHVGRIKRNKSAEVGHCLGNYLVKCNLPHHMCISFGTLCFLSLIDRFERQLPNVLKKKLQSEYFFSFILMKMIL